MKKILLTAMFVTLCFGVGANAQTVFVPSPPVIYIPQLDQAGMSIQQEIVRQGLPHWDLSEDK